MTQRPPQQPPLDAEERALAKALPRLHGRTAPGPDLDASILAAAQAAVRPVKPWRAAVRPRIRWIGPAALAASVVLAVGMAWQLRPLPRLQSAQPAATSDVANTASVRRIESAPFEKTAPLVPSEPEPAKSAAPAHQQITPAVDAQETAPSSPDQSLQAPVPPRPATNLPAAVAIAASPTPAPPVPPAPAAGLSAKGPPRAESAAASPGNKLDTRAADRTLGARTAAPAAAASTSSDAMARDAAPAGSANKPGMIGQAQQPAIKTLAPAPAPPALRNEAEMAADAGFVDAPDDDVPPATVDSPAVRDAWLHRIGELLEQGKRPEAKASLAEFRRRYPAAVLPSRLHALEIEP